MSKYGDAGFPGCVGAVDVTKLHWKNCPVAHKGKYHYKKDEKLVTVGVEAWWDHDLYIWGWLAGRCGTDNEKTLMAVYPLFINIMSPSFELSLPIAYKFVPGGATRRIGYFIADEIYPE